MEDKQKWVNETLESFSGMVPAQMDVALRTRIMHKLQSRAGRIVSIDRSTILRAAAAIALLVALNVFSVSHFIKFSNVPARRVANALSQEYFSYVDQPVSF